MVNIWILIAAVVGIVIPIVLLARWKAVGSASKDNALQTLGFTLVVLGIVFGDDLLVGYSFIGVGVLLSIISAVRVKKETSSWRGNR